ncbi:MAG: hypothetical protein ACXWLP_08950 [Myxococcaceae bacterium]
MSASSLALTLRVVLAQSPVDQAAEPPDPTLTVLAPELEVSQVKPPQGAPLVGEFGARTELRVGEPVGADSPGVNTELEVDPVIGFRYLGRTGGTTLVYEPTLYISSYGTQKVSYLHRARLNLDVRTSDRLELFLNARGAFGQNDFSPLTGVTGAAPGTGTPVPPPGTPVAGTGAVPPVPGTLPDVRFLEYVDAQVSAGFTYALARGLDWVFSAGYVASGGARVVDRGTLPLQQGPIGQTRLHWTVGPHDIIEPVLVGSHQRFSGLPGEPEATGPTSTVLDLVTGWTHGWVPGVETTLAAGASGYHITGVLGAGNTPLPPSSGVRPAAAMVLRLAWAGRNTTFRNELQALLSPGADRLTGIVNQRIGALLSSRVGFGEALSFTVSGEGTATQNSLQRDARIEGRVTYSPTKEVEVYLGARAAWIRGTSVLGNPASQWTFGWAGFLGLAGYLGSRL